MTRPYCETCTSFASADNTCRRFAPKGLDGVSPWPLVDAGKWCDAHSDLRIVPKAAKAVPAKKADLPDWGVER